MNCRKVRRVFASGALKGQWSSALVVRWHRKWNMANPWTSAGNVAPDDWPAWMRHLKDL
ncbi:MAG: hypothetical protein JSW59_05770 [Phycisphaerales bacterium]|nr:MAG: hypothetical protein JSW59_05770 [Phycisphaerales bacterium]